MELQWNPDVTMYQGTGKITSLCRGLILNKSPILENNNQNYRYIGVRVFFFRVPLIYIKYRFMLSVRVSRYGCTREVWRAREWVEVSAIPFRSCDY